ncbi:hypothetical protein [Bacillus pseudomycoides]|uniref:hypothetical protein n=1 Tax=Bacillus pseudomycoides TaxID=64104 RepID=UPI00211D2D80|nr:hypothetical protein [Bacillus pseudomycoides]
MSQLNDEIRYLRSEIEDDLQQAIENGTQPNETLKESLNQRYAEKTKVSEELTNLETALKAELGVLKEDLLTERLSVLKAGRDEQERLSSEIKCDKVNYLKKVVNLSGLSKSLFEDVSSYDEIAKLLGLQLIPFEAGNVYPYPIEAGDTRYSPFIAPSEIAVAHGGDVPYEARSYEQNYMNKPYTRGY